MGRQEPLKHANTKTAEGNANGEKQKNRGTNDGITHITEPSDSGGEYLGNSGKQGGNSSKLRHK